MSVPSKGQVGRTQPFHADLGTAGGAAAYLQTS